jgi:F-type H+-transporting ATPase subunit c
MFLNFQGLDLASITKIAAAMAIAFGGLGPAIAIGIGVRAAMDAIGRNPEAENAVRTTMIIGLGLAEAVAIYCFVVALIIAFV